ncbi:MAG: cardiolipin synthase [Planctomycetes bacterium]|nr:cardiolipin synthase [Planctomycetota bacterium]
MAALALLVPLLHLFGLYCAYRAIVYTRTPQGAVAWAVSLVTLPYLAVPLYVVFGRRKFVGYVKARRAGDLAIQHVGQRLHEALREHASDFGEVYPALYAVERLARLHFTRGNRVDLLVDGEATFAEMFRVFEEAQDYLVVQFFILTDDTLGREFQRRLAARARAGVRVYLLYDEIGCISLPGAYLAELRAAGVDVRPFHTRRGPKNRFQINFRNHRKVVVADGRVALVGGLNVGDEYLGRDAEMGPWRDTHARYEGPAVQCVQLAFLEDWFWATREVPPLEWTPRACAGHDVDVLVLPSGPADGLETASLFYTHAIHSAEDRLWISSPYFVPDDRVVGALQLAALRGVDVRILLPRKADHMLVWLSSFSYIRELSDVGVRVFRYTPGFLHQKAMLVDDLVSVVTTANLDNRSFRLNFELTMVALDVPAAQEMEAMFARDLERSVEVHGDEYERRGAWFRFLVNLARLFSPVQ